jgi:gas vesicle protein GvpA/GvpJ/GvpM family
VQSSGLADVLERVLDKGMVITGDIKIKLVDIELLTISIRLIICSVERAREMGMDWWTTNPELSSAFRQGERSKEMEQLNDRVRHLEARLAGEPAAIKS